MCERNAAVKAERRDEPESEQRRARPPKVTVLEYHPMDSRIGIADAEICQTLNGRMGTGGNNVPLVMQTW